MKINKGYTLSQFVELITSHNKFTDEASLNASQQKLYLIYKYNLFLKQKPTKGMFINEIEKPKRYNEFMTKASFGTFTSQELKECNEYYEAEKKVIFKNQDNYTFNFNTGKLILFKNEGEKVIALGSKVDSLAELFRLTNGELETKNIEI